MSETHRAPHPFFSGMRRPALIAHRGWVPIDAAVEGIFDNTRQAFEHAVDAGADVLETDTQITADGHAVLFHDPTLKRLTGEDLSIRDLNLPDLRARLRDRGELLTLEEALHAFPESRFNIDVKDGALAESVGRTVGRHSKRVLLTSFSDAARRRTLDVARETSATNLRPATSAGRETTLRLVRELMVPRPLRSVKRIGTILHEIDALQLPEWYGPVRLPSQSVLRYAHDHGVQVHVWTVNEPERMKILLKHGVDGIITDRIDIARSVLA